MKPKVPLPIPLLAYRQLVFLPTTSSLSGLFEHGISVLDIISIMIAANLTQSEVIWLLFELVLIVLRTRIDKTVFTYKKLHYINLHFRCRFI